MPAGLSAAWQLLRQGYRVDLFEALPMAGGLLHSALPPYRLPRHILQAELERLLGSGITFLPGKRLGRDMSLAELESDYPFVFLAPGTQRSRSWDSAGATPRDLHVGLDLLKQWISIGDTGHWSSVAVIGGGNTAIDLARILKHAGVESVHVVTHQSLPGTGEQAHDRMPAIDREIEQALEEGVTIHEHRGVQRLVLRGEQVVGVELVHMKGVPRDDGSIHFASFEGTESMLSVEQVIPAIGQVVDPEGLESLLGHADCLAADKYGCITGHPQLLTGGDACGSSSVSEAIGDGRRAALQIARSLQSGPAHESDESSPVPLEQLNLNYYEHAPRPVTALVAAELRNTEVEIEPGLQQQQVHGEGQRCLSCGSCLGCDNCWTLCPDLAVLKRSDALPGEALYVFDYDYCKGCGLCAHECPSGYISMQANT